MATSYFKQVKSFRRDTRLFLAYNLLAYVGYGVFQLIFNLYLTELHLRENDMGAFQSAQTLVMAGAAATMGPVLQKVGIWRSMVAGLLIFLVTSLGLAWAEQTPVLLALSALAGVGLAYLFTATMPFIIAWTPRDQRQHVSTIAFAVVTESIFAWPGMGKLIIDSIQRLDRPVIVAYLCIIVFMFIVINLVVDILYSVLDPRVRLSEAKG